MTIDTKISYTAETVQKTVFTSDYYVSNLGAIMDDTTYRMDDSTCTMDDARLNTTLYTAPISYTPE